MIAAALLALAAAAPGGDGAWRFHQSLAGAAALEAAVPEGPLRARVERAVLERAARGGPRIDVVDPADEPRRGRLGAPRPRVVLGGWDTPGVARLAEALGVGRLGDGGFSFGGGVFAGPGDALVAWLCDPSGSGVAAGLYLAAAPEDLLPVVRDLQPPARPSLVLYDDGNPVYEAALDGDGAIDLESVVARGEAWTAWRGRTREVTRGFLRFHAPPDVDDARLERYARAAEAAAERLAAWVPAAAQRARLGVQAYGHLEDKLGLTGDPSLATLAPVRRIAHVLLAPGVPDDGGAAPLSALLHERLGPPAASWIAEALPAAAAGTWWGADVSTLAGRAARTRTRTARELCDPAADAHLSPHVRVPARAALVAFALARAGDAELAADLWTGARALEPTPELERDFAAHLAGLAERAPPPPRRDPLAAGFLAGVCLEPAGDGDLGGYGARSVARSLADARAAGADAVALSTFAAAAADRPALPDPPLALRRPATASDAALLQAAAAARAAGLRVLLAPHLLTGPSGTFAGGVAWTGRPSWQAFFEAWTRHVEHYALLAELCGADVLCVGAELEAATRFQPEEWRVNVDRELLEGKRAAFEGSLALARELFGGALTYAESSSTGPSIAAFESWDRLDFVSAALFQPVSWLGARPRDVGAGTERLVKSVVAAAGGRPLVLLPVGYPSGERAQARPGEAARLGERADPERQRLLLRELARAVAPERAAGRLAGLFLWSWSTDPAAGGRADVGFTPQGKPALAELPALFGR